MNTMAFRRRCIKLSIKQRLILIGTVFVFVVYVLFSISQKEDKSKTKLAMQEDDMSDTFPHYPDRQANMLDREIGLLDPYLNEDMSEQEAGNNMFNQKRHHIGHSLLSESALVQIKSTLLKMSPHMSSLIPDIEDFIVDTSEMLHGLDVKSPLSCRDIDSIQVDQEIDTSSKKLVYKGLHHEVEVAMKVPWRDLTTKARCLQEFHNNFDRCTAEMNFQVVREILLHSVLHHANIAKLLGYCIRGDAVMNYIGGNGVIMVTEMGMPCHAEFLSRMKVKQKLQIIQSLANLLIYLESSPLGNLRLTKVTSKDFVCVKDTVKLVDLDELRLGELKCSDKKDCFYAGFDIGIPCGSGQCTGFNARSNVKKIYDVIIGPLLRSLPRELSKDVSKLIQDCKAVRVTPEGLLTTVKRMANIRVKNVEYLDVGDGNNENRRDEQGERPGHHPMQEGDEGEMHARPRYRRVDMSNFPNMFDFLCTKSRVTWGCVYDAVGLDDAKRKCDALPQCKSFVAFSKFPEVNRLFTIVLKSGVHSEPVVQDGVTLFIKETSSPGDGQKLSENDIMHIRKGPIPEDVVEEEEVAVKEQMQAEHKQCSQALFREQKKSRRSAEKRLMTHLGMKGVDEKTWLSEVKGSEISGSYPLLDTDSQFMVTFDTDRVDGVDSAMVMTQTGPDQHYLAQALAFYIDRLLGLYHVPPTTLVQLPTRSLTTAWVEPWFKPYKAHISNGYLSALMTVPKPKTITPQEVILPRPESYVRQITSLSKKQRIQLEYFIVMWLTRMPHPKLGHVGYKALRG
ncbi:uncharacterized protein LOC135476303 isoform X2 [Liolophura sinensis]|uniref:uncharacterized protein LOC135476303 isoform X2 n=1 Tax=Liolophura sinensis TaxID=3198878 RepID=UPI003157FC3A